MTAMQRSDRRRVVRFTDAPEFTGELGRDAELVERGIVRLTQEPRAALHHLLVYAGALIEGQLVCLTAYAGEHCGRGMAGARRPTSGPTS
jgi:hypothetical protein